MIADLVGLAEVVDDALRQAGSLLVGAEVPQENDKFVAAEARDEIFRPQHLPQPVGDGTEQPVPARMTESVVDLLELVEIDEQKSR